MRENHSFVSAVLAELTRRKVLRTVGGYAVAVFVVLQLMDAAVEPLRLPEWVPTLVVIGLIIGFPLAFLLAWQFQITGQGIQRTRSVGLLSRAQSFALFAFMLLATAGLGFAMFNYYAGVIETPGEPQGTARGFSAPENSIAVLPFADLSEQGNQAHFSDGIAEEILNLLAQVDGLRVAARTSSFVFRDPQQDIREIGRLLNVSTVLEGSVRSFGTRIRLTAQLINVEDGYHIWSQSFDRELDDVFAIQDEIASAIATALVDSFAGLEQRPTTRARNLAAFEAFRTGRLHWWRRSPQEIQRAIELFARALEHDPRFAPAYAAIADSLLLLANYGNIDQMQAVERAQPMIEKALAIDPQSAEAFAALGLARMQIGQMDAAESSLRQAIRLNEDYIPAKLWLSNLLGQQGRVPEQGQVLQEAMRVDPLNELLVVNYAGNLAARGDPGAAQGMLRDLIDVRPDSTILLQTLALLSTGQGELVVAWEYAARAHDLEPESPRMIGTLAEVWMALGETEPAEQLLLEGLEIAGDNLELRLQYFGLLLRQGRLEEAEQLLRELYGDNPQSLPPQFQRYYHFQTALIHLLRGENEAARDRLTRTIDTNAPAAPDSIRFGSLALAALLSQQLDDPEGAGRYLSEAERILRRGRINGIDAPEIYYAESALHALRGETEQALSALQEAYDRGFRAAWLLQAVGVLNPLRDEPAYIEIRQRILDDLAEARAAVAALGVARA